MLAAVLALASLAGPDGGGAHADSARERMPLAKARELLGERRVDEALALLRGELARAWAEGLPDPQAWTRIGHLLEGRDAEEAATELWVAVVAAHPDPLATVEARLALTDQLAHAGATERALERYAELAELARGERAGVEPALRLAGLLWHVGRREEALAAWEGLAARTRSSIPHDAALLHLARLGRWEEALVHARASVDESWRGHGCMAGGRTAPAARRTAARILDGLGRGVEAWELLRTHQPRYEDWEVWVDSWLAEGREDVVWRAVAQHAGPTVAAQDRHPAARALRLRCLRDAGDARGLWAVLRDRREPGDVRLAALRRLASLDDAARLARAEIDGPDAGLALAFLVEPRDPLAVQRIAERVALAPPHRRRPLLELLAVEGSPHAYDALRRWARDAESGAVARAVLRAHPPWTETELEPWRLGAR